MIAPESTAISRFCQEAALNWTDRFKPRPQKGADILTPSQDIAKFKSEVVEHIPALRRYARGLLHEQDAADDLVHDTVVKAIEKNHLWARGTNLKAWLFTILHNLFINQYRRKAVRPPQLPLEDHEYRLSNAGNQGDHMELRHLERALGRLPNEQREVVVLVSIQGLTYEEAADIIGIPLGTVRSRLSRGREALKTALEGVPMTDMTEVGAARGRIHGQNA